MRSQRTHLLLLALLIRDNHAFSTLPMGHHPTLHLHTNAITRSSGLQPLNFATTDYLDQLAPATTSPEEFLHQFIELTSIVASNFAVESSSMINADALIIPPEAVPNAAIMEPLSSIGTTIVQESAKDIEKIAASIATAVEKITASTALSIKTALPEVASKSTQLVGKFVSNTANDIRQSASRSISVAAEKNSLHDIAISVSHSLQTLGGLVLKVLDLFLDAFGKTSCAAILQTLQASVNTVIQDANQSVDQTMDRILHMSVTEVLTGLTTVLITVSQSLLTVVNAVVKFLSGKNTGEWALVASSAVTSSANELSAQATNTAYDLTHKSVNELSLMINDFSHNVGHEIVTSLGTLDGLVSSDALTAFIS